MCRSRIQTPLGQGGVGHPAGEVHRRLAGEDQGMGRKGHGAYGRAADGHGEALLALRGPTKDEVDPEGLLRRDGGQGGRSEIRQGGGKEGQPNGPEEQGRSLRGQTSGRCPFGLDPVPQRGEGKAVEKDCSHRPGQSQGEHNH